MNSDNVLRAAVRAYEARADAGVGGSIRNCWMEGRYAVVENLFGERHYFALFGSELVAAAPPAKSSTGKASKI